MDIQPKYTSFQLKDSGSGSEGGNLVVNWTNTYVPTYIPEGYKVSNISSSESFKRIVFENQQDKEALIIYTELSGANSPGVDTEDASEKENPDHLKIATYRNFKPQSIDLGTYHGLESKQLQAYFKEYCYRFNRRKFKGQLFNRLLNTCL